MPIELRDVAYQYPDGSPAVSSVSFSVADGERVAIIGQNGAGKTTTVKLMNGLLKPSAGEVLVDGVVTSGRSTATIARTVGYVFQNPDEQLFASDVRSEVEFLPRYLGLSDDLQHQRVDRAVGMTDLGGVLDTNPKDLPTAIRKFVAIAAVLAGDCRYIILDEPTAGLDVRGVEVLGRMLDRLAEDGIAVVTITHDMRFVADTFERVIAMAQGTVVADGRCADVFADDGVLERARVRRPQVAQLARDLALSSTALAIDEVVGLIP